MNKISSFFFSNEITHLIHVIATMTRAFPLTWQTSPIVQFPTWAGRRCDRVSTCSNPSTPGYVHQRPAGSEVHPLHPDANGHAPADKEHRGPRENTSRGSNKLCRCPMTSQEKEKNLPETQKSHSHQSDTSANLFQKSTPERKKGQRNKNV